MVFRVKYLNQKWFGQETNSTAFHKEDLTMKQKLPTEVTENGIHYTLNGDYYFPDISTPDSHAVIGHYGRMRKVYLEEHHPGLYEQLILSGKLYDHLAETDQVCRDRMERIISQMAEGEGIDEKLKTSDQLGWISRKNNIRHRAKEIVFDELVFD